MFVSSETLTELVFRTTGSCLASQPGHLLSLKPPYTTLEFMYSEAVSLRAAPDCGKQDRDQQRGEQVPIFSVSHNRAAGSGQAPSGFSVYTPPSFPRPVPHGCVSCHRPLQCREREEVSCKLSRLFCPVPTEADEGGGGLGPGAQGLLVGASRASF